MRALLMQRRLASACANGPGAAGAAVLDQLQSCVKSGQMTAALPGSFCSLVNQSSAEERARVVQQLAAMQDAPETSAGFGSTLPSLLSLGQGGIQAAMALRDAIRTGKMPAKRLDEGLRSWLATAFSSDLLQLQRITFEASSGLVLEQIGRGDAVHRIRSLAELKRRLSHGRRVYALFHPSLPQKVLAFVNIALVPDIAPSMKYINQYTGEQSGHEEADAVCAIFYSITSSVPALSGIDLGTRLIKQASEELMKVHRKLQLFSTLSPIPGFMSWLAATPFERIEAVLPRADLQTIENFVQTHLGAKSATGKEAWSTLMRTLQEEYPEHKPWHTCESCVETLQPILTKLGAHYIVREKVRGNMPLDPVTRFHVRSGAIVHRLNWWGNPTQRGFSESAAMMVNYLYDFKTLAKNNEQHIATGEIPVSESVQTLLSQLRS